MRLIDADYVKKKTLNAITMVEYDMRNAVAHGDDEEYFACENQKSAYATSITLLDLAPTIEAVPVVKAEWEECDWVAYDWSGECVRYPRKAMRCSNCSNAFKKELLWKHNFCPNCGADMGKGGAE